MKLEPRCFGCYAFRAFLQIKNKKYVAALADLTLCGLTVNESEIRFTWGIDSHRSRFCVGVYWELKDKPEKSKSRMLASETECDAIERGVKRLLAAAFQP
jgi:hypothetical protein